MLVGCGHSVEHVDYSADLDVLEIGEQTLDYVATLDESVEAGDAPHPRLCTYTSDCKKGDLCLAGTCSLSPCLTGIDAFCYRGMLAECIDEGSTPQLHACPAGEVCEQGSCVPNRASVYIWVGGRESRFRADATFLSSAYKSSKLIESRPECALALAITDGTTSGAPCECALEGSTSLDFGWSYTEATKFALQSVLQSLEPERYNFALAGLPQVESASISHQCTSPDENFNRLLDLHPECGSCRAPDSCETGKYYYRCPTDMSMDWLESYWNSAGFVLGPCGFPSELVTDPPCLPPTRECTLPDSESTYCSWPLLPDLDSGSFSGFLDAFSRYLHVPLTRNGESLMRWIDGQEVASSTLYPCEEDGNCGQGVCLDSRCHIHDNPELAPPEVDSWSKDPYALWGFALYATKFGSAEGMKCGPTSPCPGVGYECGVDGRCHDDARRCRRHHMVVFSSFSGRQTPSFEYGAPPLISLTGLARWLDIGLICRSDQDCKYPSTCVFTDPFAKRVTASTGIRSGLCSDSSRDPLWMKDSSSTCSTEERAAGCGDVRWETIYQDSHDTLGGRLPALARPADPAGNPVAITTHVVAFEQEYNPVVTRKFLGYSGFLGVGIAINGGGVWAIPGWSESWKTFDGRSWDDQATNLAMAINKDRNSFKCGLDDLDERDLP